MAYNHGREDRKWRIWKEAEEKVLRECGVDEAVIEQIRTDDRADFNSNRRFYRWASDFGEYLEGMADREKQAEVRSVSDLLDEIESETLYLALITVDKRTLQIVLKRQGFRTDLTSSQVGTKLRTDDKVAQGFGVGRMTVQRFIRLTELIPPILQMVDKGRIALTPAVELSFLKKDEQENLFATMESEEATPSLSQAQRMKSLSQSGRLDMDMIFSIMTEEKGNQKEAVKIGMERLKKYFPKGTTPKQMEDTIIKLLERELQRKRGRDSR